MTSRYRVEAQTNPNRESFIVGFFISDSNDNAVIQAVNLLQIKGLLVSEEILTAYKLNS